jgi:hypothetical protein
VPLITGHRLVQVATCAWHVPGTDLCKSQLVPPRLLVKAQGSTCSPSIRWRESVGKVNLVISRGRWGQKKGRRISGRNCVTISTQISVCDTIFEQRFAE